MREFFSKIYLKHLAFWNKKQLLSLVSALILIIVALIIQKIADDYVNGLTGIAVNDLLLDHLPTLDIDFLVVQGALILTGLALLLVAIKPKYLSFGLKAFALFIIVRSFLISLTHLGVSPHQLKFDTNSIGFGLYNLLFNTQNDFFFSGHTGTGFLLALIFWNEKLWRYVFFGFSFVLGASVLLAHIHYSIDVFAAPFITYSIFAISKTLFKADFEETTKPG